MIRIDSISKRFGNVEALSRVSLEVEKNEWLGLFGHNGSGKTTLMRMIVGLSQPTEGRILIEGHEPTPDKWRDFRRRLGFMPERVNFYEHLTGLETLRFFARLRGVDAKELPGLLEQVGLGEGAGRKVGGYSKGMKQRLNLAQALLNDPQVLVLDEPIEGLDPAGAVQFVSLLREGPPRTVVFSTHRSAMALGRVDRLCVLRAGEVSVLGRAEEIRADASLPFRVHIRPTESSNGQLEALLRDLPAESVAREGDRFIVEVAQGKKMSFLFGLKPCAESIRHIHFEEPSLEDAYRAIK